MVFRHSVSLFVLVMAMAAAGCGDPDPPAPETLFAGPAGASPNKLRGVFQAIVDEPGMSTEIRLRFAEGFLVGAARCTPKARGLAPIDVGGTVGMETDNLDDKSGSFSLPTALVMDKTVDGTSCQAGLRAGSYSFNIDELRLAVTPPAVVEPLLYGKLGD